VEFLMARLSVVGGTDTEPPMQHTPGPWLVVANNSNRARPDLTYVSVQPANPDPTRDRPLLMASGEYHVVSMHPSQDPYTIEVRKANARLIASAPELVEALRLAEDFMAGFEGDEAQDGIDARLATVRAAIAKATT
jgi:hypothetical protein